MRYSRFRENEHALTCGKFGRIFSGVGSSYDLADVYSFLWR